MTFRASWKITKARSATCDGMECRRRALTSSSRDRHRLPEVINLERAMEKAAQEFIKPHFPDEQTETQKG